ncbi:MAG: helix-turn-helix transcriptional regulator [Clostridia bacterium]
MKLRQIRIAKNRQQKELGNAIGTDEPMMSKFENYKCLPVPSMMKLLLKELNCKIEDIYESSEIYINEGKQVSVKEKDSKEVKFYRLTVNLPREAKELLKASLKKCGYKDITYWIYRCYERLQKQYEIITKVEKEKDLITASKQVDEVSNVKGNK